jgi:hypothetical protein
VRLPFLFIAALYLYSPLTLNVYPTVSAAPATFRFLIIVPRDKSNREICFGYSGNEDRKSCTTLDGENSRRVYTTYWNIRAAGEYTATAELTRMEDGQRKRVTQSQPFRVIGPEPPEF